MGQRATDDWYCIHQNSSTSARSSSNSKNSTRFVRLLLPITIGLLLLDQWTHLFTKTKCPLTTTIYDSTTMIVPHQQQHQHRKQRKLFIDLGANCGNTYFHFQQGGVVGSRTTLMDDTWETYLWEANPQMIDWYLNDLVKTEQGKGYNVQLIPKAAATSNTTISFFLTAGQELGTTKENVPNANCDPKSPYNPSGASSIYGTAKRAGQEIKVDAIDFYEWFQQLQLQAGDIVHMKMDIEGAELDIIEVFLNDTSNNHLICFWSQFWTEYHAAIFPEGSDEYQRHVEFQNTFPQRFEDKCGRPLWPGGVLQ